MDTPFAVLAMYFTKNYGLANGFAFLGASTALVLFGPLTQILVEIYSWRGALLLLGAIFFHATICGALLRPPPVSKTRERINGYLILEHEEKPKPTKENDCFSLTHNCFLVTTDSLHISIFKEPIFYVIIIVTSTVRFTHMGWVIYLVPNAEDKGIPALPATLVATVGGIGDAAGKIIPGFILWKELLNTRVTWICGMIVLSVSLVLDILVKSSFAWMLVLAFFQGLGLGTTHSLNNVVFKDIFGTERLVNAMGWIRCFSGMARVLGGFVIGTYMIYVDSSILI